MRLRSRAMILLFMTVLFTLIFRTPVNATVMTNKKIINIIYDNSGSMNGNNKWAYANYSLQTLVSLMNSEDELYITYMNKPGESEKVDLDHIEDAVNTIVARVDESGGTPFKSIDTAINTLKSIPSGSMETQYWMVILTDGQFYNEKNQLIPESDFKKKINDKSKEPMPNGSSLRIKYMGIGDDAYDIDNKGENLSGTKAKDEKEIIDVLGKIADQISGRLRMKSSEIRKIDDYTVEINSELPLYSISTLSQGTQAEVTSASAGKDPLNIDRNIVLQTPKSKKWKTTGKNALDNLKGNASVINNKDKVIPAGKYTIKFSEKIKIENLAVMYEPAIDLRTDISFSNGGKKVKDVKELKEGDQIDIKVTPVNPETGDEIPDSILPSPIKWEISYEVNGKTENKNDGKELKNVVVKQGKNVIMSQMKITSLAPVIRTEEFTITKPIVYGLKVEQPDNVEYGRMNLGPKAVKEPVKFIVLADGVPASRQQVDKKTLTITDVTITPHTDYKGLLKLLNHVSKKEADVGLKLNGDGTFTLYPKKARLHAFLIKPGVYTVTVQLSGNSSVTAQGQFSIRARLYDWIDLLFLIIFIIFVIYLIYLIFFKPKFNGETIHFEAFRGDEDNPGKGVNIVSMSATAHLHKFTGITHFGRSMVRPTGMKNIPFFAVDRLGGVYITKTTIGSFSAYGVSNLSPIDNYDALELALKTVENNPPQKDPTLSGVPFYLSDDTYIYQITVKR